MNWTDRIKRILQIISVLVGLWSGGATAISASRTMEQNQAAGQGACWADELWSHQPEPWAAGWPGSVT